LGQGNVWYVGGEVRKPDAQEGSQLSARPTKAVGGDPICGWGTIAETDNTSWLFPLESNERWKKMDKIATAIGGKSFQLGKKRGPQITLKKLRGAVVVPFLRGWGGGGVARRKQEGKRGGGVLGGEEGREQPFPKATKHRGGGTGG